MSFAIEIAVRFAHVDAAGIVFYPRYLEMVNETVERWFEEGLGVGFHALHFVRRCGVPTRRITVDYLKPSRLGDKLTFTLRVAKIGRSSFDVDVDCTCGEEMRVKAAVTLVYASAEPLASMPIPDDLRARMTAFTTAEPTPLPVSRPQ
jgi:4-hydroxybenzoyl-CoA thioesterase